MAGPWEEFAAKPQRGPWEDFAAPAAQVSAEAPKENYGLFSNIVGGVAEPIASMASGIVAKPVSDVVGLGSLAMEGLRRVGVPFAERDPLTVQQNVQNAMTYQLRTTAGQMVNEYNPFALAGRGVNWLAGQEGRLARYLLPEGPVANALASGSEEAVRQMPMFLGLKTPVAATAVQRGLRGGAEELMTSALKPPLSAGLKGQTKSAVGTLLDEGINVTGGGAEILRDRVNTLNDAIAQRIDNSPAIIDKTAVSSRMQDLLDKFQKQVAPLADVSAIQKVWDEFTNHPLLQGNDIPVKTAQELKQGTYRALGNKSYGEIKGAEIEAQKTLARGLKDEIAKAVPEVSPLNAAESKMLDALSLVERRVLISANKNPLGLGWLTLNPAKMAAFMADRSELFKSLVARMLNQGSKMTPDMTVAGPVGGISVSEQANQTPQ